MQFWIIEDGEKRGPIEDFELREMIRNGKIQADTKVWYEEADGWRAAKEITLIASEFSSVTPPPIPVEAPIFHPWRRLGARWFDVMLYQLLLLVIFRIGGISLIPDEPKEISVFQIFAQFLPMILMEAAMLNAFGATPGKMLLRLRVTKMSGQVLPVGAAVMRSLRVWVLGMGMISYPVFIVAGHVVAFWLGVKKGAPLWDLVPGYRVDGTRLSPERSAIFVILFGVMIALTVWVAWPWVGPIYKEALEEAGK